MFKKLLVPIDGSEPSESALRLAIGIAKEDGAQVVFVHVVDVASLIALGGATTMDPGLVITSQRELGEDALKHAAETAEAAGVHAATALLDGEVVQTILDRAREERVDAIVMGSHGRGGLARAILGSKTEGVLRRASVPVIVAPHAATVAQAS